MADRFRVTLAQLNPVVGDLAGNAAKARAAWEEGRAAGADLVALPEMFITGYNAQDLVMKPAFHTAAIETVRALAADCAEGPALAIGGPWLEGTGLYNAYMILKGGQIAHAVLKHHLPNETVFDEMRIFDAGPMGGPFSIGGVRIGSPICEDAWHEDVAETLAETGAEFLLVPNGSPYYREQAGDPAQPHGGAGDRYRIAADLSQHGRRAGRPGLRRRQFRAESGRAGGLHMPLFDEAVTHVDLKRGPDGWRIVPGAEHKHPDAWEQDYHVMVLALRDYLAKSGFSKVLLGLSGGVDSALVATIAVDALGPANVRCVMLPSEYTSQASLDDAEAVATALGCRYDFLPDRRRRAPRSPRRWRRSSKGWSRG